MPVFQRLPIEVAFYADEQPHALVQSPEVQSVLPNFDTEGFKTLRAEETKYIIEPPTSENELCLQLLQWAVTVDNHERYTYFWKVSV